MKLNRLVAVSTALVLCPFALAQTTPAPKADPGLLTLGLHLHAGEVKNISISIEQKIRQEIQGQDNTTNQTIGIGYRMDILSVDAKGIADAKITYKSVRFKIDNPEASINIDYDSTKPTATPPPGAEGFSGLLNESMELKFAPDGQVIEVTGVDALIKHVLDKVGASGGQKDAVEQSLKKQFGDKAVKQMFEQVTRIYPDHPVKIGDYWSRHAEIANGMQLIMDTKYALVGRNNGIANISLVTTIKTTPNGAPLEVGGMKIAYELTGSQTGTMAINEMTGWPNRAKLSQKLAGKMNMEGGQLPQPMTVPVTIEGEITVTAQ
jgi:hypothetical protein